MDLLILFQIQVIQHTRPWEGQLVELHVYIPGFLLALSSLEANCASCKHTGRTSSLREGVRNVVPHALVRITASGLDFAFTLSHVSAAEMITRVSAPLTV